jgi:hypothetical protein
MRPAWLKLGLIAISLLLLWLLMGTHSFSARSVTLVGSVVLSCMGCVAAARIGKAAQQHVFARFFIGLLTAILCSWMSVIGGSQGYVGFGVFPSVYLLAFFFYGFNARFDHYILAASVLSVVSVFASFWVHSRRPTGKPSDE